MFPFKIRFTASTLRIDPVNHLLQTKLTPPHNESHLEQDIHRTPVKHIIHLSQTQLFFLLLVRGQSVLSEYILHFSLLVYSCINIHLLLPFLSFVFFLFSVSTIPRPKSLCVNLAKIKESSTCAAEADAVCYCWRRYNNNNKKYEDDKAQKTIRHNNEPSKIANASHSARYIRYMYSGI